MKVYTKRPVGVLRKATPISFRPILILKHNHGAGETLHSAPCSSRKVSQYLKQKREQ